MLLGRYIYILIYIYSIYIIYVCIELYVGYCRYIRKVELLNDGDVVSAVIEKIFVKLRSFDWN